MRAGDVTDVEMPKATETVVDTGTTSAAPHLRLVAQGPGVVYAAWAVAGDAGAHREELVLRIAQADGRVIQQVPLPATVGHWYFHIEPALTATAMHAEIGLYGPHGFATRMACQLERGLVDGPAQSATDDWAVSDESFAEMAKRAGGVYGTGGQSSGGSSSW